MFEDATFHSSNTLHSQIPRWLLAGVGVNLCLLAAMILLPLVFPEDLSPNMLSHLMYVPSPPATHHDVKVASVEAASHPMVVPTSVPTSDPVIQRSRPDTDDLPPAMGNPLAEVNGGQDNGTAGGVVADAFLPSTTPPPVKPAVQHSVRLTSVMTAGLLVSKTTPVYPSMAKTTGTSGTVVLAATISTTGSIENLRVVSGSPMLRQAAIDAVKTWRYRPYQLNGQPVEVETTVNVVFTLAGR